MTVECKRLINGITGLPEESSSWTTVGKQYTVLEISACDKRSPQFRILSDGGRTPTLHDCGQFETICGSIPLNWVAHVDEHGLRIGPPALLRKGFWEDFFDQKAEALKEFKTVLDELEPPSPRLEAPVSRGGNGDLLQRLLEVANRGGGSEDIRDALAGASLTLKDLEILRAGLWAAH